MKNHLLLAILITGVALSSGCATKKYVTQTTAPIQDKLNSVASQTDKQGQQIGQQGDQLSKQGSEIDSTKKELSTAETDIAANKERSMSADARAGDALNKADQNTKGLGQLRQLVANLDDYKPAGSAVVPFGFNKDALTPAAKSELDRLVADKTSAKRYFIAVEGFTDHTGTVSYNNQLSRRRAENVMQYLVAKHNIPVYRIHMIGLGEEKPVDPGNTRSADAKNRRVEVTFYTADNASTRAANVSGDQSARH